MAVLRRLFHRFLEVLGLLEADAPARLGRAVTRVKAGVERLLREEPLHAFRVPHTREGAERGQVRLIEVGMHAEASRHCIHGIAPGDLLARYQLHELNRIEARQHHHARAADHVPGELGDRHARGERRGNGARIGVVQWHLEQIDRSRQDEVVVRAHAALGRAGGTARVLDREEVGGRDAYRRILGRGSTQKRIVVELEPVAVADTDHMPDCLELMLDAPDLCRGGGLDHHVFGAQIVGDIDDLGADGAGQRGRTDDPDLGQTVIDFDELERIVDQHERSVAFLGPELEERVGEPVGARIQLAPSAALVAADQRLRPGGMARVVGKCLADDHEALRTKSSSSSSIWGSPVPIAICSEE